jgi:hypothetical protein
MRQGVTATNGIAREISVIVPIAPAALGDHVAGTGQLGIALRSETCAERKPAVRKRKEKAARRRSGFDAFMEGLL